MTAKRVGYEAHAERGYITKVMDHAKEDESLNFAERFGFGESEIEGRSAFDVLTLHYAEKETYATVFIFGERVREDNSYYSLSVTSTQDTSQLIAKLKQIAPLRQIKEPEYDN